MHTRTGMAVAGGLLIGASLPPMGFWPLAFVGLVLVDRAIDSPRPAVRFRFGWLAGFALLAPTSWWMHDMSLPGWIVAAVLLSAILGVLAALLPSAAAGRWLALPGAWLLFEAIRGRWPFGGVPLSNLAFGQVGGPLAGIARVGGSLLVGAVTVAGGVALSAAVARRWRPAAIGAGAVVAALALAGVAPRGTGTGRTITVAAVQGGGEQGTRATETDPREVFDRHLAASEGVEPGTDLVLWPEDVIDVDGPIADRIEGEELSALSSRLGGVLVLGIIEQTGDRFTNEAVAYVDGEPVDAVGKERPVPFGEFVPFRSFIELFSDEASSRDAIKGTGPAVLDTPVGPLGVVISWEVFFPDRARDAIGNGGAVLLNPTNGSSFSGTQVQSQQVASSRLRAIETGRWVVQAAPTGFSAIVTPGGRVVDRTGVSEQAVLHGTVELRTGRTWAVALGDWHTLGLAVALLVGGRLVGRRLRPDLEEHGDRTVVHQGDGHLGAEPARLHVDAP